MPQEETMFESILHEIEKHAVVPVIAIEREADAGPLADALVAGGLPIAEVTFRTAAAEASIRTMAKRGDVFVIAGTVLDVETVKRAIGAGARSIVSPGFNPKVVSYCVENKIPITPGVLTPTEIEMALDHGLRVVKFFPAESFGGLRTIQALAAPYAMMRFIPTGGIDESQLAIYLGFKPVVAVGGGWLASKPLLADRKFDEITRLAKRAREIAATARR